MPRETDYSTARVTGDRLGRPASRGHPASPPAPNPRITALPDDGTGPNDSTTARSYTIGLLNAWSAREGSTVKSLFATAAADPQRREEILRDPFDFAIERALELATKHVGPHTLVRQLCKSIAWEDRSMAQDRP